jgi:glyoxylase-like metal-dependent hydrolase (beta-lactamase superfamily II)
MYLLLGDSKALLLDTGVTSSPALFPLAKTVGEILRDRANVQGVPMLPLRIVHSHSHLDHIAGDSQFSNAEIAPHKLADIKTHFGLPHWPDGTATIDLGGRVIDVIPIPGHDETHIALYDRNSQILLTGDTVYPGLLVVEQWGDYTRSIARLNSFIAAHPVSFVLGAHIEMTNQPGRWFGLRTLNQPGEHVLQLTAAHVTELHNALVALGANHRTKRRKDFIIYPLGDPMPTLAPPPGPIF